jgi:hypothetical protein
MGAIHFSIDIELAKLLATALEIRIFIETGTFEGDTLDKAKEIFPILHTVELSPELHGSAVDRFKDQPSIRCHCGDSATVLKDILNQIGQEPFVAWLDAHWCAGSNTAGVDSQCPLLEEIKALTPLHPKSVLWIDDARYLLAPPTYPLVMQGWPSFQEVLDQLHQSAHGTHDLIVGNDTILFVPKAVAGAVREYFHHHGADWLLLAHQYKQFDKLSQDKENLASQLDRLKKKEDNFEIVKKSLWFRMGQKAGLIMRQA